MAGPLLALDGLTVAFRGERGAQEVLTGVTLAMNDGEILGVVGESGSGKSVTALAVMGLLGEQGRVTAGSIRFAGADLVGLPAEAMRRLRGKEIAMIFQEPMTSLNPLFSVGFQIAEVLETHLGLSGAAARDRGIALLQEVGIPAAAARYDGYPHELSGGMRQRVMIAMALACSPRLLIADEPTTALDVTIQAQILALMRRLRQERGSSILLITHDMGVIARTTDRVAVMYAGEVVETAPTRALLAAPAHPYAALLLAAMPTTRARVARLPVIAGQMAAPGTVREGCRFRARCPLAISRCAQERPPLSAYGPEREVRCFRAGEMAGERVA